MGNPYNEGLRPFENSLKLCPSLIVENNWKGGEKQSGDGAAGLQCKHFAEDRELQLLHCRCIVDALWEIVVDRVACLHLGHRYSQSPRLGSLCDFEVKNMPLRWLPIFRG